VTPNGQRYSYNQPTETTGTPGGYAGASQSPNYNPQQGYSQHPGYQTGQQPTVYGQQPAVYGQQPAVYGQQPAVYGQPGQQYHCYKGTRQSSGH